MKAANVHPFLQEWKRSKTEDKFHLTSFHAAADSVIKSTAIEALSLETHLQILEIPFSQTLPTVLPCCPSIHSLNIQTRFQTSEQMSSLFEALRQSPSLSSLALEVNDPSIDLSCLPLSFLKSFKLTSQYLFHEPLSEALTKFKPHSLTSLEINIEFAGSFEPLSLALLQCPLLTHLHITNRIDSDGVLPIVQVLHRFPLTSLTLDLVNNYSDDIVECLSSFVSQSSLQDLKLGDLSPRQLKLLVDVLPFSPSLNTLEFRGHGFDMCSHDSVYLALFSALPCSSLRFLLMWDCSFRVSTLRACLSKVSETHLTRFYLHNVHVYADYNNVKVRVII
jgi:hypothetical protein